MEKIKKIVFTNKKWILLFICCIVFIAILEQVFEKEILKIDTVICSSLSNIRTDCLTAIMKGITTLANASTLIFISAIILTFMKEKRYGIAVSLNLIFIAILSVILKNLVQRPRPIQNQLISETGYSFPSGHSMASMAFYGLIIYYIYHNVKNKYIKWSLCIILGLFISFIGISRIYLGVHYPSDVISGFFISLAYLILFTHYISSFIKNNSDKQ